MDFIQIIGIMAAALTTGANIPQTYKMIKTKSTKDVSVMTYSMLVAGFILWVVYGIVREDYPVLIANSISVVICSTILCLKFSSSKTLDKIKNKVTSDE